MIRSTKLARHFCSLALAAMVALAASQASAQRSGSWVDIGRGFAGAGASANGELFQYAKSKSKSKDGVQYGHGFAVAGGRDGITLSNSIGGGTGPLGAAHNLNLTIGRNGTHLSHGGVVSEGGNRRVISGGSSGSYNGRVSGGSSSTGFGNNTRAYSRSHTRQFYPQGNVVYPSQNVNYGPVNYGPGNISRGRTVNRVPVGQVRFGGFRVR